MRLKSMSMLPLCEDFEAGVGHEVVVQIGILVGIFVEDSPTMGET